MPFVIAAWLAASGTGMWQLHTGKAQPVANQRLAAQTPPARLPHGLRVPLAWSAERPLLVVAAHPQCSLLPATFDELTKVLRGIAAIDLRVLVYSPRVPPADWDQQAFVTLSQGLPAHCVVVDRDGELAHALGADRSGHVRLYTPAGALAFAGGITKGEAPPELRAADLLRRAIADPPDEPFSNATLGRALRATTEEAGLEQH